MKLPESFSKYFWDIDFNNLEVEKSSVFVIERILEYGDEKAVRWMLKNFDSSQIKKILSKRRGFSGRSANYWSLILNIPKNKILCLNKLYQKMQKSHWPH
jgi:hypothetical protein